MNIGNIKIEFILIRIILNLINIEFCMNIFLSTYTILVSLENPFNDESFGKISQFYFFIS